MSRLTYLPRDRTEEPVERRCHSKLSNRWAFLCTLRPNCVDGDPSMSTLTTTIDLEQIHILGDHAIRALPELTEVTTKWLINKDPVEGCSTIRSRISRMSGRKPMTGTGRSSRKLPLASTLRPMNRALIRLKTRAASCNFGEWYSKFMLERLQGGLKTHAYDYTPGAYRDVGFA